MSTKNPSNTQVKVGWILASAMPEREFPLATTLNTSCLDLSSAISWNDFELAAGDSGDIDDRALTDLGNAVSRGAASYSATLSMFRDLFNTADDSVYVDAFEAFRVERTLGYLIMRVNKDAFLPWAAGDEISVFKLLATTVADNTEGETSTRFTVSFLPQGFLAVHTMVGAAGVITGIAATDTLAVGDVAQLQPILAGASLVSRAKYSSSNPAAVSVSAGGTKVAVGAGEATITVSYGAATAPVTQVVTAGA